MNIHAIQNICPKPNCLFSNSHNKDLKKDSLQLKDSVFYTLPISFKAKSAKYLKAKEYLVKEFPNIRSNDLFKYDLNKLNGIQDGIKVFSGLTIAEIAFVLTTLSEFATIRGCKNNCTHCYAEAKPPLKETETHTKSMLWEDFNSLTDGIAELNKRLGFYASGGESFNHLRYLTAFHDSDSLDVILKDSLGFEHDFIEIANKLYDSMGVKVIFDTAGWNLSDKKSQVRAEKYVEYYSKPENRKKLDDINISFSPFHGIHTKEVELRKAGNFELADKLHNIYTDRMANTFFTFTPFLNDKNFSILASVLPDENLFEGFTLSDTMQLFQDTLDKLEELYIKDYESEQKFIKSKSDIYNNVLIYEKKFAARYISFLEKAGKYFGTENSLADDALDKLLDSLDCLKKEPNNINKYRAFLVGIVDANGKFYMTNYEYTLPTEIRLNFDNKKETAPIKPRIIKDFIIKKNEINNLKFQNSVSNSG